MMDIIRASVYMILLFCSTSQVIAMSKGQNYYEPAHHRQLKNLEDFYLKQGMQNLKQGQYHHAFGAFSYILYYYPNHPIALKAISTAALKIDKYQEATLYFERALTLYPKAQPTYALFSEFLYNSGRLAQAQQLARKAKTLKENNQLSKQDLALLSELSL